mgnify:CR=1 FL=1
MNHTYSLADALIVLAVCGTFVAWMYLRHKAAQRRVEIVHRERLAAMEKGIPLPELPSDPPKAPADPRQLLVHGAVWIAFGLGSMIALAATGMQMNGMMLWPLPMPLLLLGIGLILTYALVFRTR